MCHERSFARLSVPPQDGSVVLNGAKVVQSMEFADAKKTGIVHEMDGFISPTMLWRYADQRECCAVNPHRAGCPVLATAHFLPTLRWRVVVRIPGSN